MTSSEALAGPWSTVGTRVRAVPAWAYLTGIVALSTVVRLEIGRHMVAPWIMVDEIVYSELAKSFAATGHFLVRDQPSGAYGFLYPLLIAPAWRLFHSGPDAYGAAKAINSLLMSLAAIPAYFLGRRLLSAPLALAGALLSVAIPSLLYTGTIMTENAFYPLFLVEALLLVLVLERPTPARQVLLLVVAGLCFLTRAQAVALLPAIVTAPLLLSWLSRGGRRSLGAYRVLWSVLGAGVAGVLVFELGRGRSPLDALGAYRAAGERHYTLWTTLRWLVYHLGELDLYLGVAPFAAFLLIVAMSRRLERRAQVFVAASLALSIWLLIEVAAFASENPIPPRVEERNMFYLAPLFLIALLTWVERGAPRPPIATGIAVVLAAGLPGAVPFERLIGVPAQSDTLALLPWWWLQDHWITLSQVQTFAVVCSIAVAAAFAVVPRRFALALPAFVFVMFLAVQQPILAFEHGLYKASVGALFQGETVGDRDWVDAKAGRGADVKVVWSGRAEAFTVWENEFFSRSVGAVYYLKDILPGGLPETKVSVGRRDGLLRTPDGRTIHAQYAFTDESVPLAGRRVGDDPYRGMVLLKVDGPLRWTTRTSGVYSDTWIGAHASYTRLGCTGGRVAARIVGDNSLFKSAQTLTAHSGPRVLRYTVDPAAAPRTIVVPLAVRDGTCRVDFAVAPTRIPGAADERRLGLHLLEIRYLL